MRYGTGPQLKRGLTTLAVLSVAYLVLTLFVKNSYYQLILTLVPVWALFGVSWNILSGYGGQLSFGHASFFGIGAYVVTLALVYWNLTPWLGIPLGMLVAGLAAVLIGLPTFRLRGHYFALSMLACAAHAMEGPLAKCRDQFGMIAGAATAVFEASGGAGGSGIVIIRYPTP